jgi:transposase-like protein
MRSANNDLAPTGAAANIRERGRPSSYSPQRCDEIIAIMREGYTVTAAAGRMGLDRATLYRWAKAYPEFCDALGLAKGLRVLRWERELLSTTDATRVRVCIAALMMDEPYKRTERAREIDE